MAGHSHFSNIKHKKDRKDSNKSKSFLKLGDKIRVMIKDGSDLSYKKAYSLARENNFPKEKIDLIIRKNRQSSSADKNSSFFSNLKLLKFDFNIMILISPQSADSEFSSSLKKHFDGFNFSEIDNNKISNLFKHYFVLKIKSSSFNFENTLDFLADKGILKDVFDFSEVNNSDNFDFKIVAHEKKIIDEVIKMSNNTTEEFSVEREFVPYAPVELSTEEEKNYFKILKILTLKLFSNSEAFFNLL